MFNYLVSDPWYPDGSGGWVNFYSWGTILDPKSVQVVIPVNEKRSMSLSMAINNPMAWIAFQPYWMIIWVWYFGDLVFSGPIITGGIDPETQEVNITALGPEAREVAHFIRNGDQATNSSTHPTLPNPYNRKVPPNGVGVRMVRDAAELSPTQLLDYPPLGIRDGYDDTPSIPTTALGLAQFDRGAQVFSSAQQLSQLRDGPDIEIAPVIGTPGKYADLNTYDRQGGYSATQARTIDELDSDGAPKTVFHDGFGRDNAIVNLKPGGRLNSHVHVLSAGKNKKRITVADVGSAEDFGAWVDWEQTDFKASQTDLLTQRGEDMLRAYGRPPQYIEIHPKINSTYRYLRDYMVGSFVSATTADSNTGQPERTTVARITKVTLSLKDASGLVETDLEVIPVSGATGTEEEA